MPYKLSYLEDDGIVLCEYLPPYPMEEFAGCIAANLALAEEHGSLLFLGDCRAIPAEGSVFDVYALGAMLDESGVDRRMREALVISPTPEAKETFDFFVTVTSNRGIKVRVFEDVEEATQWLRDEAAERDKPLDTAPASAGTLRPTTE